MFGIDWFGRRAERARIDAELTRLIEQDAADMVRVQSTQPEAKVIRYEAGEFLVVDNYEIPRAMIEDIWIERHGHGPGIYRGEVCGRRYAVPAELGMVMIETISGNEYPVECSRHLVDRMYQAIDGAWKNGVAADAEV